MITFTALFWIVYGGFRVYMWLKKINGKLNAISDRLEDAERNIDGNMKSVERRIDHLVTLTDSRLNKVLQQ